MRTTQLTRGFLSGAAGALTLTLLHETARRASRRAPRMDLVAMRGLASALGRAGVRAPGERALHRGALAGDLVLNAAYYALVAVGRPRGAPVRGVALGLAAGAGALILPRRIGLGDPPGSADRANQIMTVAWYLAGGVAAGLVHHALSRRAVARGPATAPDLPAPEPEPTLESRDPGRVPAATEWA